MAELKGFILSVFSIKEIYESLYAVYLPEAHTCIHDIVLYQIAVAKLEVDKAISYA